MKLFLPMQTINESITKLALPELIQSRNESKKVLQSILKEKNVMTRKSLEKHGCRRNLQNNPFWNNGQPLIQELINYFNNCCKEINSRQPRFHKNNVSIKRALQKIKEKPFEIELTSTGELVISQQTIINDREKLYRKNSQHYGQFWNEKGELIIQQ